jgi:biopolymer transport protein ExbD
MDRSTPVLIRADRKIALQTFVDVLDVVKTEGFTRVSLQTESAQ